MLSQFRRHLGLLIAALAGAQAWAPPAAASGAFFAQRDAPIRQVGEQVLFVDNADGTTTAVIQMEYAGAAPEFAWLLPVAGMPTDLTVTASVPFDRLARVTAPRFPMDIREEGDCKSTANILVIDPDTNLPPRFVYQADDAVVVSVAGSGSVDAFEWTIISIAPSTEDRAGAAIAWLIAAGFEVPDQTAPLLEPYLANGMSLLALRLRKNSEPGAIRPVQVTYPGPPTLPIRLSTLAGIEAMGVLVYVLGPARAVPLNYPSLELNVARLDWFEPGLAYRDLVTSAVREAGGRGFVTELSQPTEALRSAGLDGERVVEDAAAEAATLLRLRGQSYGDSQALLAELIPHYASFQNFRAAVDAGVSSMSERTYVAEYIDCFLRREEDRAESLRTGSLLAPGECVLLGDVEVSQEVVFREIEARIVKPLQDMQALLGSGAWLTRLYMTVSPPDMTVDPTFGFNPQLPPVSSVQAARLRLECGSDRYYFESPTRIELPNGGVLRSIGGDWPAAASALPANAVIRQHGTTGQGSVLQDNTGQIDQVLEYPDGGSCGLALAPSERHGLVYYAVALALGALVAERRRRRAGRALEASAILIRLPERASSRPSVDALRPATDLSLLALEVGATLHTEADVLVADGVVVGAAGDRG